MKYKVSELYSKLFRRLAAPLISQINESRIRELRGVERLLIISNQHQKTFSEFKNCNTGRDVVMIGAGPTVKNFRIISGCLYLGLNSACMLPNIKFDYLFAIDKVGVDKIYPSFASIDCVKFLGDQNLGSSFQIPESEILKMGNVRRYMTDAGLFDNSRCALHIESQPLGNFNSVSLQAMQFLLYTNPRRIYIVGIDCSSLGHFNDAQCNSKEQSKRLKDRGQDLNDWAVETIKAWQSLRDFASVYYPETEIISVNPVGLKGMFKDIYQTD